MDKAKQVVANFVAKDGKHKTTVDEEVRPSVVDEHVHPHQHEDVMTAVDKEVHQHHHHTVVQPVKATEKLPEKHTHHSVPVEHRVFNHEDEQELHDTLERDAFKYKNSSVTHETTHSSTTAPAVASEHVHHHVHEHVQPIVQKETVAPEVIHTTIPLHETHHVKAVHHGTSTLPPKTMEEWKKEGGVLGGRVAHTLSDTSGCPAPYKTDFQKQQMAADKDMHSSVRGNEHAISAGHNMGGFASTGSNDAGISKGWPENSSLSTDKNSHYSLGSGGVADTTGAAGIAASSPRVGAAQVKERQKVDSLGVRSGSQAQTNSRASLVDKLNPFKDADGDGKKGVMD